MTPVPDVVRLPGRFEWDATHFEQPPLAYLVRRGRPGGFVALVNETVLAALQNRAAGFGFLAGAFGADDADRIVLVERAASLAAAGAGVLQDSANLEETCRRAFPGLRLVGWYHSRTGRGPEPTPEETSWHHQAFPLESQVGLIVDPGTRAAAIYTRPAGANAGPLDGPAGFYLYRPAARFKELIASTETAAAPRPWPAAVRRTSAPRTASSGATSRRIATPRGGAPSRRPSRRTAIPPRPPPPFGPHRRARRPSRRSSGGSDFKTFWTACACGWSRAPKSARPLTRKVLN